MGEHLRRLLEEGVRVAYGDRPELVRFVSAHHVSPSLARLFGALPFTFPSSDEALAWLDRPLPESGESPFDLIASGEAARLMREFTPSGLTVTA